MPINTLESKIFTYTNQDQKPTKITKFYKQLSIRFSG